jgi:hypothetical protein
MRKLKLDTDAVSVESFEPAVKAESKAGTVQAYETYERSCYTPVHDCWTLAWVYPAECGFTSPHRCPA